jgi:hypothetical protein
MSRSRAHRPSPAHRAGPSNLLADVGSLVLLALALLGTVGMAYRMLRPGGWAGTALDYLWEKSAGLVWVAGFGIVIAAALLKNTLFPRHGVSHGDLLLYVGVAVGLFFLFKLIATGSL